MPADRLYELMVAWRQGVIRDAEVEELAARLQTSEQRAEFVRYLHGEATILEILREEAAANAVTSEPQPGVPSPVSSGAECSPVCGCGRPAGGQPLLPSTRGRRSRRRRRESAGSAGRGWRWAVLSLAAAAMLLLLLMRPSSSGRSDANADAWSVQVLQSEGDARCVTPAAGVALQRAMWVHPGEWVQTDAAAGAQLQYPDGTRLRLSDRTRIRLLRDGNAKRVRLERGTLLAEVTHQDPGARFTVVTPHAEAEVLGTAFSVAAGADTTRLEVIRGRVAFRAFGDRQTAVLLKGQSATADRQRLLASGTEQGGGRQADASPAQKDARPTVVGYTLIDADTDLPIPGFEGMNADRIISLATLPTRNLNLRADTRPALVGSIVFEVNGRTDGAVENWAPYAVFYDSNNANVHVLEGADYRVWTPELTSYRIQATPYADPEGGGDAGVPLAVTLTFIP